MKNFFKLLILVFVNMHSLKNLYWGREKQMEVRGFRHSMGGDVAPGYESGQRCIQGSKIDWLFTEEMVDNELKWCGTTN